MKHPAAFGVIGAALVAGGVALAPRLTRPLVAQETGTTAVSTRRAAELAKYRPSVVPDRLILTWKGDPARSQAVTWRTDTSVRDARAQIAVADGGPKFVGSARTVPAESTPLTGDLGEALYHSVNFEDLHPATRYVYRAGDGSTWSEWLHFTTAADRPEPFSFIYFGDAQNDLRSMWSRVVREAQRDAPKAAFMIHAGDLINRSNADAEWGEWFGAGGWLNGMVPSVPTPGNHEYYTENLKRMPSKHWRPQFTLPENGLAGLEETCYYLDYQGARIISLNSNERQAEQVPWLEKVLSDNPNRWTIVTFHHPLYSTAKGRDNKALRALWQPVLAKHRVDLVLQGHDHTYARSNMKIGVNVGEKESGTVYVVSVSGPKMYNIVREPWMERAAEDTQLYQIISIDGDKLTYEARTASGQLYDSFRLRKRQEGPNRLTERVPEEMPERLRQIN